MKTENRLPIFFSISPKNGDFDLKLILEFFQIFSSSFASKSTLTHIIDDIPDFRAINISNYSFDLVISWEIVIVRVSSSIIIDIRTNLGTIAWNDDLIRSIARNNDLIWNNLSGDDLAGDNLISSWFNIGNILRRIIFSPSHNIRASIVSLISYNLISIIIVRSKGIVSSASTIQKLVKIVSVIKINIIVSIVYSTEFEVIIVVQEKGTFKILLVFLIKHGHFR